MITKVLLAVLTTALSTSFAAIAASADQTAKADPAKKKVKAHSQV